MAQASVTTAASGARGRSVLMGPAWGALAGLGLLLLALAIYLPGFPAAPVMDDASVCLENPGVRAGGDWLSAAYFSDTHRPIWRPLALLTFHSNQALWPGGRKQAGLVNLALAVAIAWLALALMRGLSFGRLAATLAAAVFLVQPFLTESVVRLAGRSDLLAACCLMGAMGLHVRWARRGPAPSLAWETLRWALWGLLLLLGLLSKEIALVLPLLALAFEVIVAPPGGRRGRTARLIGIVAATVVVIVSWAAFREGVLRGWPHEVTRNPAPDYVRALTDEERIRFALALPAHYGSMLIGTESLLQDYSHLLAWPESAPPVELGNPHTFGVGLPRVPTVIGGMALLAAAFATAAVARRRRPGLAFGAAWVGITMTAALPLLGTNGHVASVRDLLLPVLGLVLMLGALAERFVSRERRGTDADAGRQTGNLRLVVVGLLGVALLGISIARTREFKAPWGSQAQLMDHLAKRAPASPEVPLYYGQLAIRRGEMEYATAQIERSVALFPRNPRALLNLGILYKAQGRTSVAGRVLQDALFVAQQLFPGTAVEAQAHLVLGAFMGDQDMEEGALEHYRSAIAADSTNFHALARAGALEALHHDTAREGIRHIRRALELDRMGALGPLADHIRELAERAERYLRVLEGDGQDYDRAMDPDGEEAGGDGAQPPE